jgi:hypothetical protein
VLQLEELRERGGRESVAGKLVSPASSSSLRVDGSSSSSPTAGGGEGGGDGGGGAGGGGGGTVQVADSIESKPKLFFFRYATD